MLERQIYEDIKDGALKACDKVTGKRGGKVKKKRGGGTKR